MGLLKTAIIMLSINKLIHSDTTTNINPLAVAAYIALIGIHITGFIIIVLTPVIGIPTSIMLITLTAWTLLMWQIEKRLRPRLRTTHQPNTTR